MDKPNSFLTTPMSILLGSILISIAVLISSGVIKVAPKTTTTANVPVASPAAQAAQPQAPQPPKATLAQVKDAFTKAQIKFGDQNSKLVIVEIADPSCPYCQIAAGKNSELNKRDPKFTLVSDGGTYLAPVAEIEKLVSSGKASFAWIYFPGHGAGEMGTKAMYCANEKGKFWEVHNLLMSSKGDDLMINQVKNDKTKSGDMADFLQSVFDPTTMKTCLDSGKYDNRLNEDIALARSLGMGGNILSGTPGFYINATPFGGAYNYTDMESTVKTALGI